MAKIINIVSKEQNIYQIQLDDSLVNEIRSNKRNSFEVITYLKIQSLYEWLLNSKYDVKELTKEKNDYFYLRYHPNEEIVSNHFFQKPNILNLMIKSIYSLDSVEFFNSDKDYMHKTIFKNGEIIIDKDYNDVMFLKFEINSKENIEVSSIKNLLIQFTIKIIPLMDFKISNEFSVSNQIINKVDISNFRFMTNQVNNDYKIYSSNKSKNMQSFNTLAPSQYSIPIFDAKSDLNDYEYVLFQKENHNGYFVVTKFSLFASSLFCDGYDIEIEEIKNNIGETLTMNNITIPPLGHITLEFPNFFKSKELHGTEFLFCKRSRFNNLVIRPSYSRYGPQTSIMIINDSYTEFNCTDRIFSFHPPSNFYDFIYYCINTVVLFNNFSNNSYADNLEEIFQKVFIENDIINHFQFLNKDKTLATFSVKNMINYIERGNSSETIRNFLNNISLFLSRYVFGIPLYIKNLKRKDKVNRKFLDYN